MESTLYKGTAVLIRAVRKILSSRELATMRRQKCVLEISDKGIKMIDKSKGEVREQEVYLDRDRFSAEQSCLVLS